MKRWLLWGLLCGLCLNGFAQSKEAKFVIDGLFFSEKPAGLKEQSAVWSVVRNKAGQSMWLLLDATLSEEDRKKAIPREDVPCMSFTSKAPMRSPTFSVSPAKSAFMLSLTIR